LLSSISELPSTSSLPFSMIGGIPTTVAVHMAIMPNSGRKVMVRYAVGSPLLELKVLSPLFAQEPESIYVDDSDDCSARLIICRRIELVVIFILDDNVADDGDDDIDPIKNNIHSVQKL
ncbi:hypothetical protein KCV06_g182, partial [Aureobasidium melanogenum]